MPCRTKFSWDGNGMGSTREVEFRVAILSRELARVAASVIIKQPFITDLLQRLYWSNTPGGFHEAVKHNQPTRWDTGFGLGRFEKVL